MVPAEHLPLADVKNRLSEVVDRLPAQLIPAARLKSQGWPVAPAKILAADRCRFLVNETGISWSIFAGGGVHCQPGLMGRTHARKKLPFASSGMGDLVVG